MPLKALGGRAVETCRGCVQRSALLAVICAYYPPMIRSLHSRQEAMVLVNLISHYSSSLIPSLDSAGGGFDSAPFNSAKRFFSRGKIISSRGQGQPPNCVLL